MVDLGVDDLVEDGGDGFFGGPEPRQIQTEKKSVALPLSGKEEPKEGGVSLVFERSAKRRKAIR